MNKEDFIDQIVFLVKEVQQSFRKSTTYPLCKNYAQRALNLLLRKRHTLLHGVYICKHTKGQPEINDYYASLCKWIDRVQNKLHKLHLIN